MEAINTITISVSVVSLIWIIVLTVLFLKTNKALKNITKGVSKKDLKTILNELVSSLKDAGKEIEAIQQDIDDIEIKMKAHIQKIGFIRFNPFSDTGGNQSFSFCLLDDHNDGIVITSLHSRDSTRIYSKKIKNGTSKERELSKEEKEALKDALN
jgi:hypothetical protein